MPPGILEAEGLGRSAGRARLGIKVKENLPSPEVRKGDLLPILIGERKIRGLVIGLQFHIAPPFDTTPGCFQSERIVDAGNVDAFQHRVCLMHL